MGQSVTYHVTCLKCKNKGRILIFDNRLVDWGKSKNNGVISARLRLDNQWGWQCICGNDDIMTQQELKHITNKQEPDPKEIEDILKDLKPDKSKFVMERA